MAVLLADCIKLIKSNKDSVTDMENCEFTYEWTIKNFKQLCRKKLESPSFSSHYADFDDVWILKSSLSYSEKEYSYDDPYLSVALHLQSFNSISQLPIKCKLSINNDYEITMKYNSCELLEKIVWDCFISHKKLKSLAYIQNDELKICCTITMPKKLENNSNVISSFDAKQQLNVDMEKLLLSEKSADVTIHVGQKSFRAIKAILAVRSPVFAAMFNNRQFKRNKKKEVVIDDIDEDVFEELLHCIYTGELSKVNKMPIELLAAAEKYQVDCLKNICEEIICETINVDNVASILVCSDRYNLEKLNNKCLKFMKENLPAIMSNKKFQVEKKKYPEIFVGVLGELLLL